MPSACKGPAETADINKDAIQIFNVGAERMLGDLAAEVINTITPDDISDPQEVIARAAASSVEFATPIATLYFTLERSPSA